ncbi:hypothetical protein [Halorubrum vacuolatum]|uniref:Uncharacterized protein n=1 Tax=Halorubrum vacuolatum TaxID=63740 RepID=A0A238WVA1_HALVU|nr:hypothetical protein [Halorubrum vacuolatum]SNR50373.1 hypothetical protein SAMN06264855_11085 [Halorubrum vacuolatum]
MTPTGRRGGRPLGGALAIEPVGMSLAVAFAVGVGTPAVRTAVGVGAVRLLPLCCGIVLFVAAVRYAVGRKDGLAWAHGLAGVGLGVAAVAGDGVGVWAGVVLAGIGGVWVLHSTRRRIDRRRPPA